VEKARLDKEIQRLEKQVQAQINKLANEKFLSKAPQDVVDREKQKQLDWTINLEKFKANRASLEA